MPLANAAEGSVENPVFGFDIQLRHRTLIHSIEHRFGRRPLLQSFWHGRPLGWVERACLRSMVAQGHAVHLYSFDPVENLPEGVVNMDAEEVTPRTSLFQFDGVLGLANIGSFAPFSDWFRYNLIRQTDGLWIDTDAYLLSPLIFLRRHVYAWESKRVVGAGILGLPRDSEILGTLIAYMTPPIEFSPWVPEQVRKAALEKLDGAPLHVGALRYASWGPPALSWAVRHHRKAWMALPGSSFYPVHFSAFDDFILPEEELLARFGPEVRSVHLFGSILNQKFKGRPPEGSFLDRIWREGVPD